LKSAGYSNSFIVGDTPRDISVAKKYDLKVVAVSTGAFSLEELEKFAPNLLIRNLEDDLEILLNFIISIS
jgi:phosphoglycolate phosphatase-like HAD superfamily hydrolase